MLIKWTWSWKNSVTTLKNVKYFLTHYLVWLHFLFRRTHALDQEVKMRFPSVAHTICNYNSRLVVTIIEHMADISLWVYGWERRYVDQRKLYWCIRVSWYTIIFLLYLLGSIPQVDSIFEILQKTFLKSVFVWNA